MSTLETNVDNNTASITQTQTSIDGIEAQYTVKVEANGNVSGLELLAGGTGPETNGTSFIAQADEFGVNMPTGTRIFTVDNTGGTFNGSVTAGNVTVEEDLITFGTTSGAFSDAGRIDFRNSSNFSVGDLSVNSDGFVRLNGVAGTVLTTTGGGSMYVTGDQATMGNPGGTNNYITVDNSLGTTLSGDIKYSNNNLGLVRSYTGSFLTTNKNYVRLPATTTSPSTIMQWGYQTGSSGAVSVTFPISFPTACRSVSVTTFRSSSSGSGTNYAYNVSSSGFTAIVDSAYDYWWIAFGD